MLKMEARPQKLSRCLGAAKELSRKKRSWTLLEIEGRAERSKERRKASRDCSVGNSESERFYGEPQLMQLTWSEEE